jgi:hypothetical protein
VSGEFGFNAPLLAPSGLDQQAPTVALLGGTTVVVWQDFRDGQRFHLSATSLDPTGAASIAPAVSLPLGPSGQLRPSLASNGSEGLLAWFDDGQGCGAEVMAVPLSASLQPMASPVRLSTGACHADARPVVVWNAQSDRWLVAWGNHGPNAEVHGALLDASGAVVVPDFTIGSGPNAAVAPTALAQGSSFLVAWEDDRLLAGAPGLFAATVSVGGAVVSLGQVVMPTPPAVQHQPVLVATPLGTTSGVLLWLEASASTVGPTQVRAARFSASASFSAPFTVETGSTVLFELSAAVLPDGVGALISYLDRRDGAHLDVFVRRLEGDDSVSGELLAMPHWDYFSKQGEQLVATANGAEVVASGATTYVNGADVVGLGLSAVAPLTISSPLQVLSLAAARQAHVTSALDGTNYLAIWADDGLTSSGHDSVGQLIQPGTGALLGPDAGLVYDNGVGNVGSYPVVAGHVDAGFFLAWGDHGSAGQLMGECLGADGVPSGGWLLLSDVTSYVDVHDSAWLRDGWATVSLKDDELHGRRTSPSSAPLLTEVRLAPTVSAAASLEVASHDDALLAAYDALDAGRDVYGLLWRADGGLTPLELAHRPGAQQTPAVAAGPGEYLVAWADAPDADAGSSDIAAARVGLDGTVLDAVPLVVTSQPGADVTPTVGWNGSTFVVAWVDAAGRIVGVRVSEAGAVLDAAPWVLSTAAGLQAGPHLRAGPPGELLLTYEAYDADLAAIRARGRLLTFTPDGGRADAGLADAGLVDADLVDGGGRWDRAPAALSPPRCGVRLRDGPGGHGLAAPPARRHGQAPR